MFNVALAAKAVALVMLMSLSAQAAVSIINPGLELLPQDSVIVTVPTGQTYNGWTSNNGIEFVQVSTSLKPSAEGMGFVDLNGVAGPGSISQTIGTDAGQLYEITFGFSGNPGVTGDRTGVNKPLTVMWNNVAVANFLFVHQMGETHANLHWIDQSFQVTGTGSDVLAFVSTGGQNDAGPMIDHIRFQEINVTTLPTPAAFPAGLIALGALALRRRRRR